MKFRTKSALTRGKEAGCPASHASTLTIGNRVVMLA